jgi:hypothetical protein
MTIKAFLFKVRAVVMTVSLSISIGAFFGGIVGLGAMFIAFFFGASNQVSAKVGIGYVGFPVFLIFFVWGLLKVPGFLRRSGLI